MKNVRTYFCLLATLVLAFGSARGAGSGFQARLDDPPSFVTSYRPLDIRFSAALVPKSRPILVEALSFPPRLTRSSFESQRLVFQSEYGMGKKLVPVAVDADPFLAYRLGESEKELRLETFRAGQLAAQKSGREGGGINFGVPLPKRLNRMFGEGGGNLKVSGYRRISFSGRSQWTDGTSDLLRQSKFPSLGMEQNYQFNIDGTIGTKISVKVSEDSQTDIPLSNRIQLRYTGDEDDIIKTIEAGNTNLSLPQTKFVGYSQSIQGLFGFKVGAQLGNLSLTGIVSQEKGSSERTTITASGEESAKYLRDRDYVRNRVFDLIEPSFWQAGDEVLDLYIFRTEQATSGTITGDLKANLYVDPATPTSDSAFSLFDHAVEQIPVDQYKRLLDPRDREIRRPFLVFNNTQREDLALGIYLRVRRQDGSITEVGDLTTIPRTLKMIKPNKRDFDSTHPIWPLMWRNCYEVGRAVSAEDLNLQIYYGLAGTEETGNNSEYQKDPLTGQSQGLLLQIMGLDQYNTQQQLIPDGKLDAREDILYPQEGLLIFPSRFPFNGDTTFVDSAGNRTLPLIPKVPNVYGTIEKSIQASRYYLKLTTRGTTSQEIRLNRVNIIEGSERVTLNGAPLNRGTDYEIDYGFGTVKLLTEAAKDPNAVIAVDFEYAPFLAIQKKSLFGARAEYEFSPDFKIGGTYLYKSDKAQDRKPRVGQETARATVLGFDTRFKVKTDFLTKAIDAIPMVTTETPSQISVSAELAQSRPNPNVNNDAYVDDFETTLDEVNLGTIRTFWTAASRPDSLPAGFGPAFLPDTSHQVKLIWHNPEVGVPISEVYPDRKEQGTLAPLRMIFRPNQALNSASWAGVQTNFNSRISQERARLFEIRLRGERGKLHFDFGLIDEDVNGNGKSNSEDGVVYNWSTNKVDTTLPNGAVDLDSSRTITEDIGYDNLPDNLEPGHDQQSKPDPSNDNFYFRGTGKCPLPNCDDAFRRNMENPQFAQYYDWINGTEGNRGDLGRSGPDQERSDVSINTANAYFSYTIDLADTSSPFLLRNSRTANGWRTFQIPIRDTNVIDRRYWVSGLGPNELRPNWDNIEHVRVWFESCDTCAKEPDTVDIADWYFVQSYWRDSLASRRPAADSVQLVIESVSRDEDQSFSPPPGVTPYVDPSTGIEEQLRAMSVRFTNIGRADTCLIAKNILAAESYTGYRRLQFWVNSRNAVTDPLKSLFFFLRIGTDSANFYEIQDTLTYTESQNESTRGWSDVTFDFNQLSAFKNRALQNRPAGQSRLDTTEYPYRIVGSPNLGVIKHFAIGFINTDSTSDLTGRLWVDEMRLTDVRKDVGTAMALGLTGNLADLIDYSFNIESRDAYFRQLAAIQRGGGAYNLGSGKELLATGYGVNINLHKFAPKSWNMTLPVRLNQTKTTNTPLLLTGTDIILPPDAQEIAKEVSTTTTLSASESFNRRGKNPLFSLLLNRQNLRFSYSRTRFRSEVLRTTFAESYSVQGDYNLGWEKAPSLPLFSWAKSVPLLKRAQKTRLGLYPSNWRVNGQFERSYSHTIDISGKLTSAFSRLGNYSSRIDYSLLQNLKISQTVTSRRDLTNANDVVLTLRKFSPGLELNYAQNISSSYDPKLLSFLTAGFSWNAFYSENRERISNTRSSSMGRTWAVSGSFRHEELFKRRGAPPKRSAPRSASNQPMIVATPVEPADSTTADSTAAKPAVPAKPKEPGRPIYDYPLSLIRFLTGWIEPVSYKYSQGYNNDLHGMLERPSFLYQFGIERDANVVTRAETRAPSATESESFEFRSGFRLDGISTDVSYRTSTSRDLVREGALYERTSTSWPELKIRVMKFKSLPLVKTAVNKFIDVFTPQTSFSRQTKEDKNRTSGFAISRSESKDQNPVLSVTFKLIKGLSLSGTYSRSQTTEWRYGLLDGAEESESRSTRRSITATSRYSFTSPGGIRIPLFGRLKFTSTLTVDVNIKRSFNKTESKTPGRAFVPNQDNSDFSVSPVISYNFSQQIRGGLTALWQDNNNKFTGRKSHTRQLQIWAEIRF